MKNEEFEKYMQQFMTKSTKEKETIVFEQLKVLASLTNSMCKELNVDNEIIINKELLDLSKSDYTEADFAEAMIVLINSIQNSLCDFNIKFTEIMDFATKK
jgi:hypothetical protein